MVENNNNIDTNTLKKDTRFSFVYITTKDIRYQSKPHTKRLEARQIACCLQFDVRVLPNNYG